MRKHWKAPAGRRSDKLRGRGLIVAIAAPAMLAVAAFAGIALAGSANAATTRNFYVTLYGWPDNSPPGDGTAFGSGHAGGTGTYSNPITFATDQHELAPGTIVYYPYLHRYFIMQDECVECDQDWANGKYHIDLWVGGKGGNTSSVLNCEDALTQDSAQVILSPPSNEPVDTTPLFNSSTNKCYDPGSFHGGTPTANPTTAKPSPTPTKKPSPTPTQTGQSGSWQPNHAYTVGQTVTYGGHTYRCLQSHTSQVGWEPPNVPALWQLVS
jgi:hypothetical protein